MSIIKKLFLKSKTTHIIMVGKKSAAQLRRLEKRAETRGEKYEAPTYPSNQDADEDKKVVTAKSPPTTESVEDQPAKCSDSDASPDPIARQLAAAKKLESELKRIDDDKDMKSKDRRSAKRKAEAIATEESGLSAEELVDWYKKNKVQNDTKEESKGNRRSRDPLIAFVGQLSYETTIDDLFGHIHSLLGDDYPVSKEMVKIRILTDAKTQRSRGMAFVEITNGDPEFLYALLTLHQTMLKGRRINIERSAGGKKHSEARKTKLDHYRKEQQSHFAEVVEKIFSEYKKTGELRENELDEGVITVLKRHSGPVVHAALAEYIEKGGRDMNNPSAYLTFLVTKFAIEGIHDVEDTGKTKKKSDPTKKRKDSSSYVDNKDSKRSKPWTNSEIDMSISHQTSINGNSEQISSKDLSSIFPSSQRGRGRGYMQNVRRR